MVKITFLGTANVISNKDHENSYLLVEGDGRKILVDCAGNPISQLDRAGVNPLEITDLILTHFHPDHVSGVPIFLMNSWLMGRGESLNIFAQAEDINSLKAIMDVFNWQDWDGFFPILFIPIPVEGQSTILDSDQVKIQTVQSLHLIPSIGVRMEFPEGILCYSSDTEPCDAVVKLAKNADILIHESTGEGRGHTSPEQAGEVALQADARKLVLTHYPVNINPDVWVKKAQSTFAGEVFIAKDLMSISL